MDPLGDRTRRELGPGHERARGGKALVARGLATLAALLALALALGPWMSAGSTTATLVTLGLVVATRAEALPSWTPGIELVEAWRTAGLGRVPAGAGVASPAVALLVAGGGLVAASLGVRSWRHVR